MTLPAADTLLLSLKNCSSFLSRTWLQSQRGSKAYSYGFLQKQKKSSAATDLRRADGLKVFCSDHVQNHPVSFLRSSERETHPGRQKSPTPFRRHGDTPRAKLTQNFDRGAPFSSHSEHDANIPFPVFMSLLGSEESTTRPYLPKDPSFRTRCVIPVFYGKRGSPPHLHGIKYKKRAS